MQGCDFQIFFFETLAYCGESPRYQMKTPQVWEGPIPIRNAKLPNDQSDANPDQNPRRHQM
jgi:hypothetical protein